VLATYITNTQNLLQKPGATTLLYDTVSVTAWINIARGQVAGEAECIRYLATIPTVVGQRNYNFSGLNTGVAATTGISGILHIRAINYAVASGQQWIPSRPWEWFNQYGVNNPVPQNAAPAMWAQYGQGSAGTNTGSGATGTFYLDPPPDAVYTLYCDCVCYPITLVDDTTVEALPYQWSDAVPFFAAYYALLSAQAGARQAEAGRMFEAYQTFMQRAREQSNPSVQRWQFAQSQDISQGAKLGIRPAQQGGGA
jgi:hypothetical protein